MINNKVTQSESDIARLMEKYCVSKERATTVYNIAFNETIFTVSRYFPSATKERQKELRHEYAFWHSVFVLEKEIENVGLSSNKPINSIPVISGKGEMK